MVSKMEMLQRPAATADYTQPSRYRPIGFLLGLLGMGLVTITLVANIAAAGDVGEGTATRETLAWTFGLTTTALAAVKLGIGTVLMGVLLSAWMRVESMKVALPQLKGPGGAPIVEGDIDTEWGVATSSATAPESPLMHRMAPKLWAPMLVMGAMAVAVGLVLSLVQSGTEDTGDFRTLSAWVQGLQFMGEGFLLSGIAFLLGSILGALRTGGGEVQESVGVAVKTLKMPVSAKLFMGMIMMGMMLSIVQFVLYIVASGADDPSAWFAWLGPLREIALALLLLSIVLALYTIGTVLAFQFNRMRDIVTTGN